MGDRAIIGRNDVGVEGTWAGVENIDANSKKDVDYSEARTIDGATVYLTSDAAAKYDAEKDAREWSVGVKAHTFERVKAWLDEHFSK